MQRVVKLTVWECKVWHLVILARGGSRLFTPGWRLWAIYATLWTGCIQARPPGLETSKGTSKLCKKWKGSSCRIKPEGRKQVPEKPALEVIPSFANRHLVCYVWLVLSTMFKATLQWQCMVTVMADLTSHIQLVATSYYKLTNHFHWSLTNSTMAHSPWCEDVGWVETSFHWKWWRVFWL